MKTLLPIVAAGILSATLIAANAGEVTGTVTSLIVRDDDGLIWVYMSGTPSSKPACATQPYWIVPNETSETGKKLYAALLAAKLSSQTVRVVGKNTCVRWNDGEDISAIIMQ